MTLYSHVCYKENRGPQHVPTRDPSWGHLLFVLGAILSFFEPFCRYFLPKVDKFSCELTFDIAPRRALRGPSTRELQVSPLSVSDREVEGVWALKFRVQGWRVQADMDDMSEGLGFKP